MPRRVRTWAIFAGLGVAVASALALANRDHVGDSEPRKARPPLMIVTSLPIVFPDEFTLKENGSKALTALEQRYSVVPIASTDAASLKKGKLLLMAHPQAQAAENLVALDDWVRAGGRVLLLADPLLEWPSTRPLGDKLRPPPGFADTGLLQHWRLTLEPPRESGPASRELGGKQVLAWSPGKLSGSCRIGAAGFAAYCTVGRGDVTVVADADFLNVDQLDGPTEDNLNALLAELATLERRASH